MPGFRCVHVWGLRCVVGVFVWPRGLWRDTVSLQRDAIVFGADLITQRASLEDTCVSQTDNTMSAGAHQSRASSRGNPYTSFPLCLAHLSITQTCGNAALYCTIWCCGCILTNSNWQAKSFLFVSELVESIQRIFLTDNLNEAQMMGNLNWNIQKTMQLNAISPQDKWEGSFNLPFLFCHASFMCFSVSFRFANITQSSVCVCVREREYGMQDNTRYF